MIACVIFVQRVRGGELHLIEVSEVVRQPERPHKQRLDRVRLLALVVDGVLEAVAVLPYYRLAPPPHGMGSPGARQSSRKGPRG